MRALDRMRQGYSLHGETIFRAHVHMVLEDRLTPLMSSFWRGVVSARRVATAGLAGLRVPLAWGADAGFRGLLEALTGFLMYRGPLDVVGSGEGDDARSRGAKSAGEQWDLHGPKMISWDQHHAGISALSGRFIGAAWCQGGTPEEI